MKVKTSELIGPALDWAVATADGQEVNVGPGSKQVDIHFAPGLRQCWSPSTNWSQGGPLIDRYDVFFDKYPYDSPGFVVARIGIEWPSGPNQFSVPSSPGRLIAAMRAIVAAKLGEEVDVPEGLV